MMLTVLSSSALMRATISGADLGALNDQSSKTPQGHGALYGIPVAMTFE
jgi:hypothetical protein